LLSRTPLGIIISSKEDLEKKNSESENLTTSVVVRRLTKKEYHIIIEI
jgi:hypothetical protein